MRSKGALLWSPLVGSLILFLHRPCPGASSEVKLSRKRTLLLRLVRTIAINSQHDPHKRIATVDGGTLAPAYVPCTPEITIHCGSYVLRRFLASTVPIPFFKQCVPCQTACGRATGMQWKARLGRANGESNGKTMDTEMKALGCREMQGLYQIPAYWRIKWRRKWRMILIWKQTVVI